MRACVQRVSRAKVTVGGQISGQIGRGMLVLLGVAGDDTEADARALGREDRRTADFRGRRKGR